MPSLLYGHSAEVVQWVADQVPHMDAPEKGAGIGIVANGHLIAGVVFHEYRPDYGTIEMSMAATSPIWARREIIGGFLSYPFHQLGVFKVFTHTPIDNERALKVNKHAGFKQEAVLAHQFGRGRHGVVCRMLQPDYQRIYEHG